MSTSDLEIKVFQQANIIAGKMINSGISVSNALYAAKYASSEELSGINKDEIFTLMFKWDQELDKSKKDQILLTLMSVVEKCRLKNLSTKF